MLHNMFIKILSILMAVGLLLPAVSELYAGVIKAEKIRTEIIEYILKNNENEYIELEVKVPNAYDIEIKNVNDPEIYVSHNSDKTFKGNMPVAVDIKDGSGKLVKHVRLIARLKSFAIVAVINSDIRRGETIEPDYVVMKRMNITRMKGFYRSQSKLIGMQAKKYMRAGTVLTGSNVCPVYLVRRGDKVNVEVHEGKVFIKTEGTARENGCSGEYIKVYVEMTKTTIICKVMNSDTVVIDGV